MKTLEIVIGIVFVFLLYSLLATILQEMFSNWYGLRAKMLRKSIEMMLNGGSIYRPLNIRQTEQQWRNKELRPAETYYLLGRIFRFLFLMPKVGFEHSMAWRFYETPILKSLGKASKSGAYSLKNTKPAYFSATVFSDAMIYLLTQRGTGSTEVEKIESAVKLNTYHLNSVTLKRLKFIGKEAKGDIDAYKKLLQQWFNDTQDRTTGWYKKILKGWLFVIGFGLALAFNANVLKMTEKLSNDPQTRMALVRMAVESTDTSKGIGKVVLADSGDIKADYKLVRTSLDSANQILGLGWRTKVHYVVTPQANHKVKVTALQPDNPWTGLNPFEATFWSFVLMALAVSLGSSFWFDMLKKLVSIRGTGVKPEEKKEEPATTDAAKTEPATPTVAQAQESVPASGNLLDEALRVFGPDLMAIPGVKAVMKGFENGKDCLQINAADSDTLKEVFAKFPEFRIGAVTFDPKLVVSGFPKNYAGPGDTVFNKGRISNASGRNGYGALGAVLLHRIEKKQYLASCWHVLKGNEDYDHDDESKVIVDDEQKQKIAWRRSGGILQCVDVGFAECMPGVKPDNGFIMEKLGFGTISYRPVSIKDIAGHAPVRYYDWINGMRRDGVIYSQSFSVEIHYADRYRCIREVLVLSESMAAAKPLSQPGNSGSFVFDAAGCAIAMIIGGDDSYTYAIKLNNVFKLYPDFELV